MVNRRRGPGGPTGPEEGSYDPDINPNINFDQQAMESFVKKFEKSLTESLQNVRKTMEKSLNFKDFQEDFENLFLKAAKNIAAQHKKGMADAVGNTSDLKKSYYNLVSTKERKAFDTLKANVDKVQRKLEANVRKEKTLRKNLHDLSKKNQTKLSDKELQNIEDSKQKQINAENSLFELRKANQQALKAGESKALHSEGKAGFANRLGRKVMGSSAGKGLAAGAASIPLLGKLVKGMNIWSVAATGLLTVFTALFGAFVSRRKDIANIEAAFRGAGMSADEAATAVKNMTPAFEELRSKSFAKVSEFRNQVIKTFGEFPAALREVSGESGEGAKRAIELTFALTGMGKSVTDSIKSIGMAAKDQAIDTKEYTRIYQLARGVSAEAVMGFDDSMNTLLNLNKAMRNVTFDTTETEKMFALMSGTLKSFTGALRLSDKEASEFMMNIGKSTAGLGLDKMIGMFQMVNERMPDGEDFVKLAKGGGDFHLQMSFIDKIMGGVTKTFNKFSSQEVPLLVGAMKEAGISLPRSQLSHFVKLMNSLQGTLGAEGIKEFEKRSKSFIKNLGDAAPSLKKAVEEGTKRFKDVTTPQEKIAAALSVLADKASGIPAVANLMGSLIAVMEKLASPVTTAREYKQDFSVIGGAIWDGLRGRNPFGSSSGPSRMVTNRLNKNLNRAVRTKNSGFEVVGGSGNAGGYLQREVPVTEE